MSFGHPFTSNRDFRPQPSEATSCAQLTSRPPEDSKDQVTRDNAKLSGALEGKDPTRDGLREEKKTKRITLTSNDHLVPYPKVSVGPELLESFLGDD